MLFFSTGENEGTRRHNSGETTSLVAWPHGRSTHRSASTVVLNGRVWNGARGVTFELNIHV